MEVFLGIDYGTGGAKGCIANLEGKVLGYYFEEYPIITSKPGWSEHDPHLYWEIACRIIQNSISQAKINPAQIQVHCSILRIALHGDDRQEWKPDKQCI